MGKITRVILLKKLILSWAMLLSLAVSAYGTGMVPQDFYLGGSKEELRVLPNTLRAELFEGESEEVFVEIYSGQEVFLSKKFEAHLKNGEFITLNNSRYMLVELDFRTDEASMMSRLQRLSEYGYVPIVAHPERYGLVIENPDVITAIKSSGCLVQINRSSVLGDFGPYIKRTAQTILRNGLADFVASDAHSQYSRTPNLSDVHEYISENISYDYADELFKINPWKVIKNDII